MIGDIVEVLELSDVLVWYHSVVLEAVLSPFSQGFDNGSLITLEMKAFAEKVEWWKLVGALSGWWENGPGRVEEDVGGELFLAFVDTAGGSVDSDNISYSLRKRQILKLVSEKHQSWKIDSSLVFLVNKATLVCDF